MKIQKNDVTPVIGIIGPTAVGKTALSIHLAQKLKTDVISGDAMQIYQGMDIGTGKVTTEEMAGIRHHLIDIKPADASFSVFEYQTIVRKKIEAMALKNKIPLIVGGTGLYIQSVLYNYNFSKKERNTAIQIKLEKELEAYGNEALYKKLQTIDPSHAKKIHPNNIRRVIRALEVFESTGKTMTETEKANTSQEEIIYPHFLIGLTMARAQLYAKINKRVDAMIHAGLIDEVQHFYHTLDKSAQSFQAIGYKEFIPYFEGHITKETAIENLKQNSRRYAKRQLTYFKNKLKVHWYDITDGITEDIFKQIYDDCHIFLNKYL